MYSWEPSPVQTGLLKVTLATHDVVAERWSSMLQRSPVTVAWLSELDWGTRRLVPMVGWQLGVCGIDDVEARLVKRELAKSMWVGRVRQAQYARVVDGFASAGLDVLVLKGVALGSLVYPEAGTRPSSDLDLFIGSDNYDATMKYLRTHHLANVSDPPRDIPQIRHSRGAVIDGLSVDIHWRLLWDRYDKGPDAEIRTRSMWFDLGDMKVRTISLEDHLLHALVHGLRPNNLASVRWVVDTALVIRTGEIRWDLFFEIVSARRLGGVVSRGLQVLRDHFDVEVPAGVIDRLSNVDSRLWNRVDYWPRVHHRWRVQNYLSQYVAAYALGSWDWPMKDKVLRYPEFLGCILEARKAQRREREGALGRRITMPAGSEWLR